ncbi:MAG: polyprenyl synthetase family protein [Bacteroidia bacterium]|nr:polyprenyl synthetase family protein [Bacteroidia bacterium]
MHTFKELQQIIEKEIEKLNYDLEPKRLYEPIKYILSIGGKRLRPVFVLMANNLYSDNIKKALPAAIALETFHNFTLLHDDIMDNSPMRRNHPTVHTKWNTNVAILSGDAMSIKAYEHIAMLKPEYIKPVLDVFTKTALGVCEGQQYDMDFETQEKVGVNDYLKMIELKTSVLIAASFKIGAILGDAPKKDINLLYDFGKNIGMAFQLQDDYLDVYGDPSVFGKSIGLDILCNKKTFLLISALELAKDKTLTTLKNLIHNKNFIAEEKIRSVTQIYNQLNVKELAEKKMNEYFKKAYIKLDQLSIRKEKSLGIIAVIEKLKTRIN